MTAQPKILHLPSAAQHAVGWTPLMVGELAAGESLPLALAASEGEFVLEKVSMWRHAGGELPYARPVSTELFYLIEGHVRIEWERDSRLEARAGDIVIVPVGFTGTWHTLEPVVKISVSALPADER